MGMQMEGRAPERKGSVDSTASVPYVTYQSRRPTITKTYDSRRPSLNQPPTPSSISNSLNEPVQSQNFFSSTDPPQTPETSERMLHSEPSRSLVPFAQHSTIHEEPVNVSTLDAYISGQGKLTSLFLNKIFTSPHYDFSLDILSPFWDNSLTPAPQASELKPGTHFYYCPQKGSWTFIAPVSELGVLSPTGEVGPCNGVETVSPEHHWIEKASPAWEPRHQDAIDAKLFGLKRGWLGVAVCSSCGKKIVWSQEGGGWNGGFGQYNRIFSKAGKALGYQTLYDGWMKFWDLLCTLVFKRETRSLNFDIFYKRLSWADPELIKDMLNKLGYEDWFEDQESGASRVNLPKVDKLDDEGRPLRVRLLWTWAELGCRLYTLKMEHSDQIVTSPSKFLPFYVFQAIDTMKKVFGPIAPLLSFTNNVPAVEEFYEILGTRNLALDQTIEYAYRRQRATDRRRHPLYLEALSRIGDVRGSTYIKSLVALEKSSGLYTISDIQKAFLDLTCSQDASEDEISKKFFERWSDISTTNDPAAKHDILEALNIVASERDSDLLRSTLASLREPNAQEPTMDVDKAKELFGIVDDCDDETLLTLYEIRIADSPGMKDQIKLALETLAKKSGSELLLEFIKTGQRPSPAALAATKAARPDFPVGLENIANTCYLNSLLQYFFTIKDLREVILQADQFEEDDNSSKMKRVGGRQVALSEIQRSRRFIILLQHLFLTLLTTKEGSVVPEIELAKLALVPGKEEEPYSNTTESTDATLVEPMAPTQLPSPSNSVLGKRGAEHLEESERVDTDNLNAASPKRRSVDEDYDMSNGEENVTAIRKFEPSGVVLDAAEDEDKTMTIPEKESTEHVIPQELDVTVPNEKSSHPNVGSLSGTNLVASTIEDVVMEVQPAQNREDQDAPIQFGPELPPALPPRPIPAPQMTLEQQVASYMSFGKQNDVSECLDNIMFQIESALDHNKLAQTQKGRENVVKDLFYGCTIQELKFVSPQKDDEPRIKEEEFFHLLVDVAEDGRDLYDGLDASFDESDVEIEGRTAQRSVMIKELPPILHIQLQRVQYDRELKRTYKSNAHMAYASTITMDRYCAVDLSNAQAVERKERTRLLRKELDSQRSRLSRLRQAPKKPPITDVMKFVAESLPKRNNPLELDIFKDSDKFLEHLMQEKTYVENEINAIEKHIKELKVEIDELWKDCHEADYELASVFMHRGEANYGHYFLLQRTFSQDERESSRPTSRWLKLNDSQVTEISEQDALEYPEGTGRANAANPYFLSYVRKGKESYFEKIQRQMD